MDETVLTPTGMFSATLWIETDLNFLMNQDSLELRIAVCCNQKHKFHLLQVSVDMVLGHRTGVENHLPGKNELTCCRYTLPLNHCEVKEEGFWGLHKLRGRPSHNVVVAHLQTVWQSTLAQTLRCSRELFNGHACARQKSCSQHAAAPSAQTLRDSSCKACLAESPIRPTAAWLTETAATLAAV